MKYKIIKTFIVYENGQKDTLGNEIHTDDIEAERIRLIAEFKCKTAHFTFEKTSE